MKLYFCTSNIYFISLVSLIGSIRISFANEIEKEPIYDVYCIGRRQYQRKKYILFWNVSVAQMIESMSGVVLGGIVKIVRSNLARDELFTASISSVDSFLLYLSVYIYSVNMHQCLILCSLKAMMFVKLYFHTSYIYLISLVSLIGSIRLSFANEIEKEPIYYVYCIGRCQYQRYLNILFWVCPSGAVGSVDVLCSARWCCRGCRFRSH